MKRMRKLGVFLTTALIYAVVAPQVMADQLPRALEGMDLASTQCITESEAMDIRGEAWSPNGFPSGQCTWYVDGRVNLDGWKLKFSKASNAYTWWDNVKNANQGQQGLHGDIMVFKKASWNSNYGHVAYVESSTPGKQWSVSHANVSSSFGTLDKTWTKKSGYNVYDTTFKKVSGSNDVTRVGGSSTHYAYYGFLYKK